MAEALTICMTSLHYGNAYGQGLCAKKIAENLSLQGNTVHVIHATKGNESKQKNLFEHFIGTSSLPGINFFSFARKLEKKLPELDKKFGFDLLYPNSWEFGLIKQEEKKPVFYHARGTVKGHFLNKPKSSGLMKLGKKLLVPRMIEADKKCIESAKKVFVPSVAVKKEMAKLYGTNQRKIAVIPDGVDLNEFNPKNAKTKKVAEKRILFAGRLVPQKGILELIEAMPGILEEFPKARLLIAGKDTNERHSIKLKKKARELDLTKSIEFLGFIEPNKMPSLIGSADVVASPSTYEPFGIINLEAIAMQKPVITTTAWGPLNKFREQVIAVKPGSSMEIEKALKKVLAEPKTQKRLTKNGRKKAGKFEWKNISKEVEKEFRKVL